MKLKPPLLLKKYWLALANLILLLSPIAAQVPEGIPNKETPIDWTSWPDRILYIGLPLLILILFLIGRMRKRKKSDGS